MDIQRAIDDEYTMTANLGRVEIPEQMKPYIIELLTLRKELQQYRQIGTVDECRAAMEKQIAKEPKRIYKKHGKHKWQRTESGKIDECAWDYGNHNGVSCEICGATVCVCCNPNYDELEDCEEEYYLCPNCGEKVPHFEYCKCGQALKWGD